MFEYKTTTDAATSLSTLKNAFRKQLTPKWAQKGYKRNYVPRRFTEWNKQPAVTLNHVLCLPVLSFLGGYIISSWWNKGNIWRYCCSETARILIRLIKSQRSLTSEDDLKFSDNNIVSSFLATHVVIPPTVKTTRRQRKRTGSCETATIKEL